MVKADSRITYLIIIALLIACSYIGLHVFIQYSASGFVYTQIAGIMLTGIGVGGVLVLLTYAIELWKKPEYLELRLSWQPNPILVSYIASAVVLYFGIGVVLSALTPVNENYTDTLGPVLIGIGITSLTITAIFHYRSAAKARGSGKGSGKEVTVKPFENDLGLRVVSRNNILSAIARTMSTRLLTPEVIKSGMLANPQVLSSKYVFFSLLALVASVPLTAFALISLQQYDAPLFPAFLFLLAPLAMLVMPYLKLKSMAGDRKRGIEDELPFFCTYASVMQSVGLSLYNSFENIASRNVFANLEKEALMIQRNVQFFFKNQVEALEQAGRVHPNEKFRGLLLGYTSEWRSGGDTVHYLDAKSKELLNDMRFRWQRYTAMVSDIGEVMVSLFFIMPVLILTTAFVFPLQTTVITGAVVAVLIPLLTTVVFMMISNMQPKTYDLIEGKTTFSVVAAIASFVVAYFLSHSTVWIALATSIISTGVFYGTSVIAQRREIALVEKALPQFLRDITEYKKMGYDINKSVFKIAEENSYNTTFDALLKNTAKQMRMGLRLSDAEIKVRSWLGRLTFFLLGEIVNSGGGTASALETLTNFVSNVNQIKKEAKSTMQLYEVLTYLTPIGLAFTVALMASLMTAFSSTVASASEVGILKQISSVPDELIQTTNMMIVAASASMAFVAGKAIDLTSKNTLRIAVTAAIAAISISLSTEFVSGIIRMVTG
ncbi:putative membrane bound type IV pili protein [Candidatus Nitrososphaera gargensis Ga9.2]|uniref:Putative membrane bound type IV pili protein n=1 Tax=Nitrososphaera gargensis (strain Ga9.2) TaxID=1237085 RepID=K0IN83_NITGG|nr:type II secretion system F family protein [Candidatus Nitrososphaera gargensis]AFU58924.1 putative membrane bound type IV pili protein [Candidatus Nitrososphaera gargensis Ga9.2]